MSAPRDTQRRKVEAAVAATKQRCPATIEAPILAAKILGSRYWRAKAPDTMHMLSVTPVSNPPGWVNVFGRPPSELRVSRGTHPLDVLLVLARLLTPAIAERPMHSPAMALTLLDLTKRFLPDTSETLKEAFKAERVKTRTVSPEAKEAARDRYFARKEGTLEADLRALRDRLAGDQAEGATHE